jgi:hypothetical protein
MGNLGVGDAPEKFHNHHKLRSALGGTINSTEPQQFLSPVTSHEPASKREHFSGVHRT